MKIKVGKMGLPDFKTLIKQKEEELSELRSKFMEICEHPNIKHHGFVGDGG